MQFTGGCNAVSVGILPDLQLTESGIRGINLAVLVGIQIGQSQEPVGGLLGIGEHSVVAEKLRAGIDDAVIVQIAHQQAVFCGSPGCLFGETIPGVVEIGLGGRLYCFDTISIEIQDDRRGNGGGDIKQFTYFLPSVVDCPE